MSDAFHGTPITPSWLLEGLKKRAYCFCVSYWRPDQIELIAAIARRVMIDCGAFSVWMANRRAKAKWIKGGRIGREPEPVVVDAAYRAAYYEFNREWMPKLPPGSFFVIFDEIDAGAQVQNALLDEVPEDLLPYAWPVWHMNEDLGRAIMLSKRYGRFCIGSTDEFITVGSKAWRGRMDELFNRLKAEFGDDMPLAHMLRGMQCQKGDFDYPFMSVDSTDLGRNHNRLADALGDITDMTKQQLFQGRVDYWEQHNCPPAKPLPGEPPSWPPLRLVHKRPATHQPKSEQLALPHIPAQRKAA